MIYFRPRFSQQSLFLPAPGLLDVDAKEELKKALQEYKGAILLVCHEPEFYQGVVDKIWNLEEYSCLT